MARQRYLVVMNNLITDIFSHRLKAGEKLPPERELARQMDVDRTTLRMALKQLESMQVLSIRQGDGIYVRNYMKYAGVDFIRFLFEHQQGEGKEIVIDEYIIDEVWEFWIEFVPVMLRIGIERTSPRELKNMMDLVEEALANINDREKIVEFQLQSHDAIAAQTHNLIFILITNSSRPLHRKISEIFVNSMDESSLREQIEFLRALLRSILAGQMTDPRTIADAYKKMMVQQREIFKKTWKVSDRDARMLKEFTDG